MPQFTAYASLFPSGAVFPASFPGYLPDRSSQERDRFVERVTAAYRKANAEIRSLLGASVPSS